MINQNSNVYIKLVIITYVCKNKKINQQLLLYIKNKIKSSFDFQEIVTDNTTRPSTFF